MTGLSTLPGMRAIAALDTSALQSLVMLCHVTAGCDVRQILAGQGTLTRALALGYSKDWRTSRVQAAKENSLPSVF